MTLHEIFRESFARFESRGVLRRTDDAQAAPLKLINDTFRERRFRTNHREIDLLSPRELSQRRNIVCGNRDALSNLCNTRISRRAEQFQRSLRGSFQRPNQCVLTPAGTNHQNSHVLCDIVTKIEQCFV
jgi:hypothetical protein